MSTEFDNASVQDASKSDTAQVNAYLKELGVQQSELMSKVNLLKQELQDWRSKLDGQVKNYRDDIGDLSTTVSTEVTYLRQEFAELKSIIKDQIDKTASLAISGQETTAS